MRKITGLPSPSAGIRRWNHPRKSQALRREPESSCSGGSIFRYARFGAGQGTQLLLLAQTVLKLEIPGNAPIGFVAG